ncbi:hypothetical protein N7475_009457 [Penicillium sp. IBT 31633x]|nr:hypothetical protein N7475_009457 [Penicillium sp. IBT 31633x]
MGCFRQMFRCLRAPFRREKGRIIEIVSSSENVEVAYRQKIVTNNFMKQGPPTDFRKEELPSYFSDAESVLSPSQNPTERLNLTNQSQHADVAGQSHSDRGEGRNDNPNGSSTTKEEQALEPRAMDERDIVATGSRKRMKLPRWWKASPGTGHERKSPAESIELEEVQAAKMTCS